MQIKEGSKPYQASPRQVAHALPKPFTEELDILETADYHFAIREDESSECCNSFLFISKPNGKVWLSLDSARMNQALIRGTINDIPPRLANVMYLILIGPS